MGVKQTEIAWAAGFFDGEGCCSRKRSGAGHRYLLGISIIQTDIRPIERFGRAVGAGKLYGPYQPKGHNSKPIWMWSAFSANAMAIIQILWPYLCEPKQEQIKKVIDDCYQSCVDNPVPQIAKAASTGKIISGGRVTPSDLVLEKITQFRAAIS